MGFRDDLINAIGDNSLTETARKIGIKTANISSWIHKNYLPTKKFKEPLLKLGLNLDNYEEEKSNKKIKADKKIRATAVNRRNYQSREFTKDTPFLCHKWFNEGMSEQGISDVLRRPISDVRKAIKLYEEENI